MTKFCKKLLYLFGLFRNLINFATQSTFYFKYMNKQIEDIKAIREMMEKSSKFLSLSGLSGISAGVIAIIGAALAYFHILREPAQCQLRHDTRSHVPRNHFVDNRRFRRAALLYLFRYLFFLEKIGEKEPDALQKPDKKDTL